MAGDFDIMKMMAGMQDSKCVWVREFDQKETSRFYEKFLELEKDPTIAIIPVFINSYGGELTSLTAMRDLIKSSPKPVATIAVGMAMSCGASLLACGTKGLRFASTDTEILIHQVSGWAVGKSADIEEAAVQYKLMNQKILSNLAKDTGKKKEFFEKIIKSKSNADWTFSAEEAFQMKIIDVVGIPRFTSGTSIDTMDCPTPYDEHAKVQKLQAKVRSKAKKRKA